MGNLRDLKIEKDLSQVGKLRANNEVWQDNLLKLRARKTVDDANSLQDITITGAFAKTIDAIEFGGVTYTFDAPVQASKGAEIIAKIKASVLDVHESSEVNPLFVAQYDVVADETYIAHVGAIQFTNATVSATPTATTVKPTMYVEHAFEFAVLNTQTGVALTGNSLISQTETFDANTDPAVTAANIAAALTTAGVTPYEVVAEAVVGTTAQVVTVYVDNGVDFKVNGSSIEDLKKLYNYK